MKTKGLVLFFIFVFLYFGILGTVFAQEQDITISTNTSWAAGTYTYNNVRITNGATLIFNGKVTLNAAKITVDTGSSISADTKGYPASQGPGAGTSKTWCGGSGAGYGGAGGVGIGQRTSGLTYGSAKAPEDLGSGGAAGFIGDGGTGGGAIKLVISDMLTVNGVVSANGQDAPGSQGQGGGGSGGSIYIITNNFSGTGTITANGGEGGPWGSSYGGGGGGGRIAIYYQLSNFTGKTEARGGIGYGNNSGSDGTAGLFDIANNYFYPGHNWRFQENDSPFGLNKIFSKSSNISSQGSVNISTNDLSLENSNFLISGKEIFNISHLFANNSTISSLPQTRIDLNLKNLNLDANSSILADGKGYPAGLGPGAGIVSTWGGSGAGYGGKGGSGGSPRKEGGAIYGSAAAPVDFGSGGSNGSGYYGDGLGGGAIKLIIADTLSVNGRISANGTDALQWPSYQNGGASGGSIYIAAKNFNGTGLITVNGGKSSPTGGGAAGGGGGGGRIAVYYENSNFAGNIEAKGGIGVGGNGGNGTIVVQAPSLDSPLTLFALAEKSSSISDSTETFSNRKAAMNNGIVAGNLNGLIDFNNFEIVSCVSGIFSGKGFTQGNFNITLDGVSYDGDWKGVSYLIPSEKKIYLKGEVSGGIGGIVEGYLTESVPESDIYDKYQAIWKINRLDTATTTATINLDGLLSYDPPYSFTSDLYLYQANMEGSAFGYYTGPLSAVVTHLRLTDDNEYKEQGFSIISYNSVLGQGEAWAYNQIVSPGNIEFQGLFKGPLLGKLTGDLDENKSPKILSGSIERTDFGATPQSDLKIKAWSPARVSPGQTITYVIEYRNNGLKAADNVFISCLLNTFEKYVYASPGASYSPYAHRLSWKIPTLAAKSTGIFTFQTEITWGLPAHLFLDTHVFITNTGKQND